LIEDRCCERAASLWPAACSTRRRLASWICPACAAVRSVRMPDSMSRLTENRTRKLTSVGIFPRRRAQGGSDGLPAAPRSAPAAPASGSSTIAIRELNRRPSTAANAAPSCVARHAGDRRSPAVGSLRVESTTWHRADRRDGQAPVRDVPERIQREAAAVCSALCHCHRDLRAGLALTHVVHDEHATRVARRSVHAAWRHHRRLQYRRSPARRPPS
jgi:hypothetical protein